MYRTTRVLTTSFGFWTRILLNITVGRTRFHRLYHIGGTSSYLCLEALKAAILEAKAGKDVAFYEQAVKLLEEIAPEESEAKLDQQWIDRTTQEVTAETARLEQELKGYKNNLIKESIRVSRVHELGWDLPPLILHTDGI